MPHSVHITALYHYPIKSLPGLSVERLSLDAAGVIDDRRWMLVNAKGRFVSQRDKPQMARLALAPDGDGYRVTAPDGDQCWVTRTVDAGAPIRVTVWKDELDGWEVSPALSAWFSKHLGEPLRLVYLGEQSQRRVPDPAALDHERVGFADGYPLLVCNQQSLDALNERAASLLDVRRFRPNLVVDGLPADAELAVGEMRLPSGVLALLKPCERCSIPAVDLDTGEYQRAVAQALKTHSRYDGKTVFGMNAVARGVRELRVGDTAVWS